MAQLQNITGAAWPTSGAASAGTVGIDTATGLTHVGTLDVPPGSTATGLLRGVSGAAVTFRVDAAAVPLQADADHYVRWWARARRDQSVSLPADQTVGYWHTFSSGGTRLRLESYLKNNTTGMEGLAFRSTSFVGGTTRHLGGTAASASPAVVPFDTWCQFTLHLSKSATGVYELFMNGALVALISGIDTTNVSNFTLASLGSQWSISMPAFAGVIWEIGGPLESWNGSDISLRPNLNATPGNDFCPYRLTCDFLDRAKGGFWETTGSTATPTSTDYASGGINPFRRYVAFSGAAASVGILTSYDQLGNPRYNEEGDFTLCFPMLYFPGTATGSVEIKTTGGATLIKLDANGTNLVQGATVLAPWTVGNRYALMIHLNRDGTARASLCDMTRATGSQRWWSVDLAAWTPQNLGKVVISCTLGASACHVDGCYAGQWIGTVGCDSMCHANVNGMVPTYAATTHLADRLPHAIGFHAPPGAVWQWRGYGLPHYCMLVVSGRTGQSRTAWDSDVRQYMQKSRGLMILVVDGGSINDLASVTDATTRDQQVTDLTAELERETELTDQAKCRVWLWTQIRREQGSTYSPFANQGVDLFNEQIRAHGKRLATNGRVWISDPAARLTNHRQVFAAGDDTHPTSAGDDLIVRESVLGFVAATAFPSTTSTTSGATRRGASLRGAVTGRR